MELVYYSKDFLEKEFPFKLEFRNENSLNPFVHAHEHFQLCYLSKGACVHSVHGHESLLVKGDLLAIPPFVPHRLKPHGKDAVELVQIDFMPIVVEENDLALDTRLFPKIRISYTRQQKIELWIASMKQEYESREEGYRLFIKADLIHMLVTAFRESDRKESNEACGDSDTKKSIMKVVRYIDEHYAERLPLEDMANMAAMSPTYFSSMFKIVKGQSFIQYVNGVRIWKSLELLRFTDYSITQICYETGFNNASHFNRTFKKSTGLSPLQYRKVSSS